MGLEFSGPPPSITWQGRAGLSFVNPPTHPIKRSVKVELADLKKVIGDA